MNLFRTLSTAAVVCLVGTSLTSCLNAPNYPVEPKIDVNAVTVFRRDGSLGLRDSVEIALNFQDGDGDLGLDETDKTGPFGDKNNRFYNNYFIQPSYKNAARVFVPLVQAFSYNGRFIRLNAATAKDGPIKGELRYAIVFSLIDPATKPGTEIRFQVSIADRALHESNVVITPSVVL